MLAGGVRRFDLYDFFSVFLPGSVALLGILPFLPRQTRIGPVLAGVLVILGFVVGRGVHSIAISIEEQLTDGDHRSYFVTEIDGDGRLDHRVISEFKDSYTSIYDDPAWDGDENIHDTVYTLVRSHVHIDSRGRSRTFQAVYAFHRSMWVVTIGLSLVYVSYGVGDALRLFSATASYTSFVGSLELPTLVLVIVPLILTSVAYRVSRDGKRRHRENYIRYLIADFVTLVQAEDRLSNPPPIQGQQNTRTR